MSGAQPFPRDQRIWPLVERLCVRMNLPMPRLYITPEQSPNAFATGRDQHHSALAFTTGILPI